MLRRILPWLALLQLASPAAALQLVFDYRFDEGFFDAPERREALERAARHYAVRIDGELGALPAEGWVAAFPHPSRVGSVSLSDLQVPADTIVIFVGARPMAQDVRLAVGGPGNVRLPCVQVLGPEPCQLALHDGALSDVASWVLRFLFRERIAALRYPAEGFAPWGGSLSFANDVPWYFGDDPAVPADRFDFLSSAVHELGHVLGIGTAESWGTRTPRAVFEGPETHDESGGPVALHEDLSHFADDTSGRRDGARAPAAFTRGLARGERKLLTELDVAALLDIGWSRLGALIPAEPGPYTGRRLKGDVDGDGWVGLEDVQAVRRALSREARLRGVEIDDADVWPVSGDDFGDGSIDARDRDLLANAVRWRAGRPRVEEGLPLPCFEPLPPEMVRGEHGLCWLLPPPSDLDLEAFLLLGWELPDPPARWLPVERPGPPRKGDLDGDGTLGAADVEILDTLLADALLGDERAHDAADVAPMSGGNSMGDGRVDERDLALLEAAARDADVDGDGIDTAMENELNQLWMALVGRPRHGPLLRWTDECLEAVEVRQDGLPAFVGWLLFGGELRFDFCSRSGTPWSLTPGISPEEYLAAAERRAARRVPGRGSEGGSGVATPQGPRHGGSSPPPNRAGARPESVREEPTPTTLRPHPQTLAGDPPRLRPGWSPRAAPAAQTAPAPGPGARAPRPGASARPAHATSAPDPPAWYEHLVRWLLELFTGLLSGFAIWLGMA